jgi:hypothetical protein
MGKFREQGPLESHRDQSVLKCVARMGQGTVWSTNEGPKKQQRENGVVNDKPRRIV